MEYTAFTPNLVADRVSYVSFRAAEISGFDIVLAFRIPMQSI